MVKRVDHVTIVVQDPDRAERYFALMGFERDRAVVIAGERFSRYMGVADIEAEHRTLVLAGATPRFEMQMLTYRRPEALANPGLATRRQIGFNHLCFAVDDLADELARLTALGVERLNQVMEFHDRKLVFLAGPEGITIELAQWR